MTALPTTAVTPPHGLDRPPFPEGEAARTLFGHPRGLFYILAAECGFAFACLGLQTMLTLYMTQSLLKPGHVEKVWGFAAYRHGLERLYGPLSTMGLASQTFGLSQSLIYALPLLGALIADRWLGQRRVVVLGLATLTASFVMLVGEATFLPAMLLMIVGVGLFKTSLIGQIGRLYAHDDDRRTRAFGLYLIAVNVGSMVAPILAGTAGERLGWRYGLSVLAIGMAAGALGYTTGLKHLPKDIVRPRRGAAQKAPISQRDLRIIGVLLMLMALDGVTVGVYNQAWNVFPVWAESHVERHVAGFLTPETWFATLDGVFTIIGTAVAVRLWAVQNNKAMPPSELGRIGVGFTLAMTAFLILAAGAWLGRPSPQGLGKAPLVFAVVFFLFADFSIPWTDTVTLTVISRDAPPAVDTTMIGVYYLFYGAGNFLTGLLGGLADKVTMPVFWLLHAAILGGGLFVMLVFGGVMRRGLSDP